MRAFILALFALVCSFPVCSQGTDADLRLELEAVHSRWMKAFYAGDIATMNQLEADNLVLIMPVGSIVAKSGPRTEKQTAFDPQTEFNLNDVSVRRFGDTAILTAILRTKSAKQNTQEGTTVVFARISDRWKIASAQWTPVEAPQ